MKYVLVLNYKNGKRSEVQWGCLPNEWYLPVYKGIAFTSDHGFDELTSHTSVQDKLVFALMGVKDSGMLWWKKQYGFYEETASTAQVAGSQDSPSKADHSEADKDSQTANA